MNYTMMHGLTNLKMYAECHLADQAIPHDFQDSDFMAMVTNPATKQHSETYLVKILIHTYLRFSFIFLLLYYLYYYLKY